MPQLLTLEAGHAGDQALVFISPPAEVGANIYIGSTKPDVSLREAAKEGAAEWEVARAGVAAMQVSPHDTMIQ